MSVGYDPDRVRALSHRTLDAITATRNLRSTDPAAAEAIRVVRLLRQNLEDHWMPALRDIERSGAMVSWNEASLVSAEQRSVRSVRSMWPLSHRSAIRPLGESSDDELIDRLDRFDRLRASGHGPLPSTFGQDSVALAEELALRVSLDPAFAARLVGLAGVHPLIGSLTARAAFPVDFVSRVVKAMMWPHGPTRTADLDGFAASLSSALSSLVDDPGACLDLLLDPVVLYGIGAWERLEPTTVHRFVRSGLLDAVVADPGRIGDGYQVLAHLTSITNGPLDRGIHPGMALGVAESMEVYIEGVAPAIRQEGGYPVVVIDDGVEIELGTYDDVVDLFGVLLREDPAQQAVGRVFGGYVRSAVATLGADITTGSALQYVTRFADLLADASRAEQAELVMQAAAAEAARRQVGAFVGFGATLIFAGGAGSPARSVTSRAVSAATDLVAPVEPATLPDNRIASGTYDLITVAALGVVASDRTQRRRAGLGAVAAEDWEEVSRQLDEIDSEPDLDERTRRVVRLDRWIEGNVPALAGYLARIRSTSGMDELTEGRNAVDPD